MGVGCDKQHLPITLKISIFLKSSELIYSIVKFYHGRIVTLGRFLKNMIFILQNSL